MRSSALQDPLFLRRVVDGPAGRLFEPANRRGNRVAPCPKVQDFLIYLFQCGPQSLEIHTLNVRCGKPGGLTARGQSHAARFSRSGLLPPAPPRPVSRVSPRPRRSRHSIHRLRNSPRRATNARLRCPRHPWRPLATPFSLRLPRAREAGEPDSRSAGNPRRLRYPGVHVPPGGESGTGLPDGVGGGRRERGPLFVPGIEATSHRGEPREPRSDAAICVTAGPRRPRARIPCRRSGTCSEM